MELANTTLQNYKFIKRQWKCYQFEINLILISAKVYKTNAYSGHPFTSIGTSSSLSGFLVEEGLTCTVE